MLQGDHSVTINRPLSDVFAFVTNMDNFARWQGGVVEADSLHAET
jgi:hypothetical protein